jgi:transcription elongation factor Elf1
MEHLQNKKCCLRCGQPRLLAIKQRTYAVAVCESCGFQWSLYDRGETHVMDEQTGIDIRIDAGVLLVASEELIP